MLLRPPPLRAGAGVPRPHSPVWDALAQLLPICHFHSPLLDSSPHFKLCGCGSPARAVGEPQAPVCPRPPGCCLWVLSAAHTALSSLPWGGLAPLPPGSGCLTLPKPPSLCRRPPTGLSPRLASPASPLVLCQSQRNAGKSSKLSTCDGLSSSVKWVWCRAQSAPLGALAASRETAWPVGIALQTGAASLCHPRRQLCLFETDPHTVSAARPCHLQGPATPFPTGPKVPQTHPRPQACLTLLSSHALACSSVSFLFFYLLFFVIPTTLK